MATKQQVTLACGHKCDREWMSREMTKHNEGHGSDLKAAVNSGIHVTSYGPPAATANGTLTMQPLLSADDLKSVFGGAGGGQAYGGMLSGNDSGLYACPTCGMEHTMANSSAMKKVATETFKALASGKTFKDVEAHGTRLLARLKFAKETGVQWSYHIVDPEDVMMLVPLHLMKLDPNIESPLDAFDKIALFQAQLAKIKQQDNQVVEPAPEFHIVSCPCGERRCTGFMIALASECMHCTQRERVKQIFLAKNYTKHAQQVDQMQLITPSHLRKILTAPLPSTASAQSK